MSNQMLDLCLRWDHLNLFEADPTAYKFNVRMSKIQVNNYEGTPEYIVERWDTVHKNDDIIDAKWTTAEENRQILVLKAPEYDFKVYVGLYNDTTRDLEEGFTEEMMLAFIELMAASRFNLIRAFIDGEFQ
jgi:hypothetical protein